MGVCNCSMFCCTLLYVHSSIAIILMGKRELVALLNLSFWCLEMVERLFLAVPRDCLRFVIVVFPDHAHLPFLKRLGGFLTKQGKLVIYNSFIASNFSYCPLGWHFCSASSTNKLEKVQERALRFINNDYTSSLDDLLKSIKAQPLHVRRIKQMACEVFKIINKMSPEYINDLEEIKTSTYNFKAEKQAEVPRVNTTR